MQRLGALVLFSITSAASLTACNSDRLYSLEGEVSFNKRPMEGVTLAVSGPSGDSLSTGSDGAFLSAGLRAGTYTITPSLDGYAFSPASAQVTVDASGAQSVTFEASDVDAPQAPTQLRAVAMSQGGVHLHWVAPTHATRYRVYRGASAESIDYQNPIASRVDEPGFLDSGARQGVSYAYAVAASGPHGESPLSDVAETIHELGSVFTTGDGQYIVLVNGTPWDWKASSTGSYQMNAWAFPDVPSGTRAKVYFEYDTTFGHTQTDDRAGVTFALGDTGRSFSITAHVGRGCESHWYGTSCEDTKERVSVDYSGLGVASANETVFAGADGSGDISIEVVGWQNSEGAFEFPSLTDTSADGWYAKRAWMYQFRTLIGNRKLTEMVMPATHDSAMSTIAGGFLGNSCNAQTQTKSIKGQLEYGSRYFDIRPVLVPTVDPSLNPLDPAWLPVAFIEDALLDGRLTTGHYQEVGIASVLQGGYDWLRTFMTDLDWKIKLALFVADPAVAAALEGLTLLPEHTFKDDGNVFLGANGQSIDSIVDDINDFLANNNEVVILNLSHGYDMSLGYYSLGSGGLTKEQWSKVVDHVAGRLHHLYQLPSGYGKDLSQLTYNQLTNNGTNPAVMLVAGDADHLVKSSYYQNGQAYALDSFNPYNCYAGVDDVGDMQAFQANRLKFAGGLKPGDNSGATLPSQHLYSAASWTLTAKPVSAVACSADDALNLLAFASPVAWAIGEVFEAKYRTPILTLAKQANDSLEADLLAVSSQYAPNMIYVDRLEDYTPLKMAMILNFSRFGGGTGQGRVGTGQACDVSP